MQLTDTHTHIYLPEFDADRDEAVHRAVSSGVTRMLMPNIDADSLGSMMAAADRYKGICLPMLGLHPTSVKADYREMLDNLLALWDSHDFVAVGEIGIDLYWDKSFLREQMEAMTIQCQFAADRGVPVAVHSRDSFPEVFSVLENFRGSGMKGVLHAFTGDIRDAERAIGLGFLLGIGGIVTFRNSDLGSVVRETGPQSIILETDSPYLAPVPHRGKRNESSYICIVNRKVAELCGIGEDECAEITNANASRLFNI